MRCPRQCNEISITSVIICYLITSEWMTINVEPKRKKRNEDQINVQQFLFRIMLFVFVGAGAMCNAPWTNREQVISQFVFVCHFWNVMRIESESNWQSFKEWMYFFSSLFLFIFTFRNRWNRNWVHGWAGLTVVADNWCRFLWILRGCYDGGC